MRVPPACWECAGGLGECVRVRGSTDDERTSWGTSELADLHGELGCLGGLALAPRIALTFCSPPVHHCTSPVKPWPLNCRRLRPITGPAQFQLPNWRGGAARVVQQQVGRQQGASEPAVAGARVSSSPSSA